MIYYVGLLGEMMGQLQYYEITGLDLIIGLWENVTCFFCFFS